MDIADRADQEVDAVVSEGRWLAQQQAKRSPAFRPNGRCHFCDEAVDGEKLFCDLDCEEDQRVEEDQLKRLGRG